MPKPFRVFLSCAPQDTKLQGELEKHLNSLKSISIWTEHKDILLGKELEPQILKELENAQIILLLISANFLNYKFYSVVVAEAMKRHKANTAWVIPIILRAVNWKEAPFAELGVLPRSSSEEVRPVVSWPDRDQVWTEIVESIKVVIEKLEQEEQPEQPGPAPQSASPDSSDTNAVLCSYLNWVVDQNKHLQSRGFGGNALSSMETVALERVYVALKEVPASVYEREQSQKRLDADKSDLIARCKREFPTADLDEFIAERLVITETPYMPSLREQISFKTLDEALREKRWMIILGDPGSGKTTLTRWIALKLASALLERLKIPDKPEKLDEPVRVPAYQVKPEVDKSDDTTIEIGLARLPVLLRISEFAAEYEKAPLTIEDFLGLHAWPGRLPHDLSREKLKALIMRYLQQGRAFVILDGLDEITKVSIRREVRDAIEAFIDEWITRQGNNELSMPERIARWNPTERGIPAQTDGNQVIITSRIVGYQAVPSLRIEVTHFTIEPMQELAIRCFCDDWMLAIHQKLQQQLNPHSNSATIQKQAALDAMGLKTAIFDPERPRIQELASNPLLITILALVYRRHQGRFPEQRAELYHKAIEILIEGWLPARMTTASNAHQHNQVSGYPYLTIDKLIEVLAPLAAHIHEQYTTGLISETEMKNILTKALTSAGISGASNHTGLLEDEIIRHIREDVGLLSGDTGLLMERSEQLYSFLHLTFQEYLAGRDLVRDKKKALKAIRDKLDDPRWHEPILMALGHISIKGHWEPEARQNLLAMLLDADDYLSDLIPRSALLIVSALPEMAQVPEDIVQKTIRRLLTAYADRNGIAQFTALREKIRSSFKFIHSKYQNLLYQCLAEALLGLETGGDSNRALASASLIAEHKWQNATLTKALFKVLPYDDATWGYPITSMLYTSALLTTEVSNVLVEPEMKKKDLQELERLYEIIAEPGRYEEHLRKRINDLAVLSQRSPEMAPFLQKQVERLGEEMTKLRSGELLAAAEADICQIKETDRERSKKYKREIGADDKRLHKRQRALSITSEKLEFRRTLEREPWLIRSIEKNPSWLRLVVLLYGGISDHGLATYITQDDEISTVFKLDKASQMSYIAELRKRAYWQESWDKDNVVANLAVHLDTRNGKLLDAALEYFPRFTPLAIFNDSPLTDTIHEALKDDRDPSTLKADLWQKWYRGDQATLRAHALLALLVIDTETAVNTLIQSLSDPVTSDLAESVLNLLQIRRRTLADALILLAKKEAIGIALLPLQNMQEPLTDAQWGDLVTLFFRTFTSVMSVPVKYDDVLLAHSRVLPYLNAEIWSYWLSGLAGDDPLYSYAVALDTLGARLESASALVNIQHAYNSKYQRLINWRPLLIPPAYTNYADIVGEALTVASQSTSQSEIIKSLFYTGTITFAWINYAEYPGLKEDVLATVLLIPPEFHKDIIADIDAALSEQIPSELQQDETGDIDEQSELPVYKATIIERVMAIADPVIKARALWRIAHYRKRWKGLDLWQCAIEAAEQIDDPLHRSRAFERLLAFALQSTNFMPPRQIQRQIQEFKRKALAAAEEISDPNNLARTLARLSFYKNNEEHQLLLSRALEASKQISNEQQQIDTLLLLYPHLAENYQLSQDYDDIIKHVKSDWYRRKGENLLAIHLLKLHDQLHEPWKWTPVVLVSFIDELVNLKLRRAKNEDFLWHQLLEPDDTKRDHALSALLKATSTNGLHGLELTPNVFEVISTLRDAKKSSIMHILLPYLREVKSSHLLSSSLERWVREKNPPDRVVWAYAGLLLAENGQPVDADIIRCLLELIENGIDLGRYRASLVLHGPTVFVEKTTRSFSTSGLGEEALRLIAQTQKPLLAEKVFIAEPIGYTWDNITHDDPELLGRLIDYADAEEEEADDVASLLSHISYCNRECLDVLVNRFTECSEKTQELLLDSWLYLLDYHSKEKITSEQKERMAEAIAKLPAHVHKKFWVIPTRLHTIATLLDSVSKQVKEQTIIAQKALDDVLDGELSKRVQKITVQKAIDNVLEEELSKRVLKLPDSPIHTLVDNRLYDLAYDPENANAAAETVSKDGIALELLFGWLTVCLEKENIDGFPLSYNRYLRTSTLLELAAATTHYSPDAVCNLCEENKLGPLLVQATMHYKRFWGRAGAATLLGYLRQTPEFFDEALLSGLQDVAEVQQAILRMAPKMLHLDEEMLPKIIAQLAHEDASVVYGIAKFLAGIAQNEKTKPLMRQEIIRALGHAIRQRNASRPVFVLDKEVANISIKAEGRLDDQLYNAIIAVIGIA